MVLWDNLVVRTLRLLLFIMLSSVVEVTCSYAYALFLYFRTTWPLSLVYGPPLQPPSRRTQRQVEEAIKYVKQRKKGGEEVDEALRLLDLLPYQEDILSIRDVSDGFDLLQHAVIADRKDVVVHLLQHGCSPDGHHCSPPLHLAAYLGRGSILRVLLEHGAKWRAKRGMCFPEPHLPVGLRMAYFGFTQHHVYYCSNPSHALTPMQCAIKQGQLTCVRMLTDALMNMSEKRSGLSFHPLTHLQYACKEGAAECIQYFVSRFPECINQYGDNGDTPLLTAVPWGEECVKILVNNGADVHLLSRGIGETALHRLYRMNIDGLFTIYDTTRYLLTTGIEQDINAVTELGETPLHMLVSHVSYAGGNYVDPSGHHLTRAQLQPDYQAQVGHGREGEGKGGWWVDRFLVQLCLNSFFDNVHLGFCERSFELSSCNTILAGEGGGWIFFITFSLSPLFLNVSPYFFPAQSPPSFPLPNSSLLL